MANKTANLNELEELMGTANPPAEDKKEETTAAPVEEKTPEAKAEEKPKITQPGTISLGAIMNLDEATLMEMADEDTALEVMTLKSTVLEGLKDKAIPVAQLGIKDLKTPPAALVTIVKLCQK